jgi:SynChlorMet cassette protein ScmD
MQENDKPIANPLVVLREEFDEWAILFDPDTGNAFGLNPVGIFIWKRLDGHRTIQDILEELRENCEDMPNKAKDHLKDFIRELVNQRFAELKIKENDHEGNENA